MTSLSSVASTPIRTGDHGATIARTPTPSPAPGKTPTLALPPAPTKTRSGSSAGENATGACTTADLAGGRPGGVRSGAGEAASGEGASGAMVEGVAAASPCVPGGATRFGRATAIISARTSAPVPSTSLQLCRSTRTSRSPSPRPDGSRSTSETTNPPLSLRTTPSTKSSGGASERDSSSRFRVASIIPSREGQPSGADHASSNGAPIAEPAQDATASPAALASIHARSRPRRSLNEIPNLAPRR